MKNMGPFKYNIENTINMSLPFPLFSTYNADGIPPDTSVKFSFNVDSNYPTNIEQFTQNSTSANNNFAQQLSIVALNDTVVKAYTIGVGVTYMTLYLCITNKENPVNELRLLNVRQIRFQIHTITSTSDSFPLCAPKKC